MSEPRYPRLALLLGLIRPHRKVVGLGLFLGLLGTGAGLAGPMVTKWVLDTLAQSASLVPPVLTLLGLLVAGTIISWLQWVLLGKLAERIVRETRVSMIRRVFRATVPQITRKPPGELVTRVTSDTTLLREAASSSIVNLINGFIGLVGTLILMGVLDMVLLAVTVGCVLVVALAVAVLMPRIATAQAAAQEAIGELGAQLEGGVRAIRTVKASRAEDRLITSVGEAAGRAEKHGVRAVLATATAWSITWSGVQLAIIVVLGVGAARVSNGTLEVSALIAFLLYAFQLMGPITDLTQNVTQLQSGIAAAGRIAEVESVELEPDNPTTVATGHRPAADMPILSFKQVTAGYGPDTPLAVDGITLDIPRRGHTAIVGPSGAGKTTLLSLVLRFLEPQEGEIRLDGRPYREWSNEEIRRRLAYVEQETPVVPGTIRENLLFTHPDASDAEIDAALEAVRLTEKMAELPEGLDTSLSTSGVSGGQRQRIALARAILRTPEVLLLDEATAQVDGLTEAAVHEVIRRQAASGTVITIAHRLSTVVDADRILLMEAGRVRAAGTHQELLENDELYRGLVAALRIEGSAAEDTVEA